jgi:DNA-binding NarL/FixJ family response regulator
MILLPAEFVDGNLVIKVPLRVQVDNSTGLSPMESRVLPLLKRALSNKEIASEMHLSERTVKFHVSNLLKKFNCTSRAELIYKQS